MRGNRRETHLGHSSGLVGAQETLEVSGDILKSALSTNDYHENYYFPNRNKIVIIACDTTWDWCGSLELWAI